jgi:predicted ATPase/DNA-binding SARP family transcriptional activator
MFVRLLGVVGAGPESGSVMPAPGRVASAVLAHLASARGLAVSVSQIIDALWQEAPESARNAVQVAISRLRKRYGQSFIASVPGGYRLVADLVRIDLLEVEQFLRQAQLAADAKAYHNALGLGREASALFVGEILAGCGGPGADIVRQHAEDLRTSADLLVADALRCLRRGAEAVSVARSAAARQPLNEAAHAVLIKALAADGRTAEALEIYDALRRRLAEELGIDPSPSLAALFASILAGDSFAEEAPASVQAVVHLPAEARPLFGRANELIQLADLVARGFRLITLIGLGGIGKTRVATAAARELAGSRALSAYFVDLTLAGDHAAVASVVGAAVQAGGADYLEALRGQQCVVVLDNAEHVLAGAIECCRALLGVPGVIVIVTSRVPLRLADEQVIPLRSLSVHSGDDPRVQLLVSRSGHAAGDRNLLQRDLVALADQADGVPLVLEMIGSALRWQSPADLIQELSRVMSSLSDSIRDRPIRHLTVGKAIEWSLLAAGRDGQAALGALTVTSGSFTPKAAMDIIEAINPAAPPERLLSELVDLSLVQRVPQPGELRFQILEPVRATVRTSSLIPPATREAEQGHAHHYINLVQAVPSTTPAGDDKLQEILRRDGPNVAIALDWCWTNDREMATSVVGPLLWAWYGLPRTDVVLARSAGVLDADPTDAVWRIHVAIARYAVFNWTRTGEPEEIDRLTSLVESNSQRLDDEWHARWTMSTIVFALNTGRLGHAVEQLGRFRSTGPDQEIYRLHAEVLTSLGTGDYRRSLKLAEALLRSPKLAPDALFRCVTLINHAYTAIILGELASAKVSLDAALELARSSLWVQAIQQNQAWLALEDGAPIKALALVAENIRSARVIDYDRGLLLEALVIAGIALNRLGHASAAKQLAVAAAEVRTSLPADDDAYLDSRLAELTDGTARTITPPQPADLAAAVELIEHFAGWATRHTSPSRP